MPIHVALLALAVLLSFAATATAADEISIGHVTTPAGVRFAVVGTKPPRPAPTLFLFGTTAQDTLRDPTLGRLGRLLKQRGFISISIDLPEHAAEMRENVPALLGWADRVGRNDNWLEPYLRRLADVLDYLVAQGYTDPDTVAAVGTSRGGFIALHFAAAEPRVKYVMGISPVTELAALREFAAVKDHPLVKSLSPVRVADKLADRAVWIVIGNDDDRVGTAATVTLVSALLDECRKRAVRAAPARDAINVELHLMPWPGHFSDARAHDMAFRWLEEQLAERKREDK